MQIVNYSCNIPKATLSEVFQKRLHVIVVPEETYATFQFLNPCWPDVQAIKTPAHESIKNVVPSLYRDSKRKYSAGLNDAVETHARKHSAKESFEEVWH